MKKLRGEVWMSNALNAAQHGLSFTEKRLIHLAASQLDSGLHAQQPVAVTLDDWQQAFGGTRGAAMGALKDGARRLPASRYVRNVFDPALGKTVPKRFCWVTEDVAYRDGCVAIHFHPHVLPELVNLEGETFMVMGLHAISGLRSKYSIRLLEMIFGQRTAGKLELTVKDLRFRMGIPESYNSYKLLRTSILDPALKEVAAKLQISVELTEKHRGGVVESVMLRFPSDLSERGARVKQA